MGGPLGNALIQKNHLSPKTEEGEQVKKEERYSLENQMYFHKMKEREFLVMIIERINRKEYSKKPIDEYSKVITNIFHRKWIR